MDYARVQAIIPANESLTEDSIKRTVLLVRRVYLVLTYFSGLPVLWSTCELKLPDANLTLEFLMLCTIYFGLRHGRHWVVPFVLLKSVTYFCLNILIIFEPAANMERLIIKIASALLLYFFAYQVAFFSKKKVKRFFGDPGQEIFS
jgi:hypothetical protein